MKKESFEKLDDWFVNLYEQWIFVRCYEKSAILVSEITWYKLFPNIDKKTWFVFLELWLPRNHKQEVVESLERRWNPIRIIDKDWNISETFWNKKIDVDENNLRNIKINLIKFN